jgi:hypothetical protein
MQNFTHTKTIELDHLSHVMDGLGIIEQRCKWNEGKKHCPIIFMHKKPTLALKWMVLKLGIANLTLMHNKWLL